MSVIKPNPNHPVVTEMEEQWVKMVGVLMHHYKLTEFEVTEEMIHAFAQSFTPDVPAVVADCRQGKFVLRLMPLKRAEEIAVNEKSVVQKKSHHC